MAISASFDRTDAQAGTYCFVTVDHQADRLGNNSMDEGSDLTRVNGSSIAWARSRDVAEVDKLLQCEAIWVSPPADLELRVMADIEAAEPHGSHIDQLAHRRTLRQQRRPRRRPVLLVAAAAALGAATMVGVTQFGPSGGARMNLAGTPLAAQAHADVELRGTASGIEITMDVDRLPPAPPGTFYQGWVKGERGAVAIGTFHLREGSRQVVLWSGVQLADYPKLTVTLQSEGAGPASSGRVVLAGDIPNEAR